MTPKTVLIADDDRELVEAIAARCLELGVKVEVAYDARTALRCICESRPDVICLDVKMPSGSGLSVCEMLVNDVELARIPVIMLTGMTDEETIRRCHRMGAYYVLKSENVWQRLCPILCELLGRESPAAHPFEPRDRGPGVQWQEEPVRRGLSHLVETIATEAVSLPEGSSDGSPGPIRPCAVGEPKAPGRTGDAGSPLHRGPAVSRGTPERHLDAPTTTTSQTPRRVWTVLYIEDDVDASDAMKLRLESLDLDVLQAFDAAEGYRLAVAKSPDLIVCDYGLPGGDGDYVLRRLRENPATENIPVIFVTGRPGSELPRRLYGEGAAGYLKKPVSREDLTEALGAALDIRLGETAETR